LELARSLLPGDLLAGVPKLWWKERVVSREVV
jgi:hypothetical protein